MMWRSTLLAAVILCSNISPIVFAQSRRLGPADILRVATISDAQISPSGEWVVYSVATTDGNQTVTNLWLARVGDRIGVNPTSRQTEPRRNWESFRGLGRPLLPSGWTGSNARWSPDSKSIAFN